MVAGAGDSWYRIADGAGISPTALLAENGASLSTTIFPGDEVCLPEGASMPTPPTTAAATTAPTTTAPSTTSDSSSSDSSTTAPSTTEASTTTAAPTTTSYVSASEAAQIIRDVWPDDLEERALEVAWRESRHRPDADNGWCCHGLFQIYYSVHADWLQDFGVYQLSDLYDARKNAEAAYALYQGAGGWGPWGG